LTLLHAEQQHTAFVVLYIDIDGFKGVNDQRGHHAGDALLKHIADRIKHTIRSTDIAARLGGDEFAIALLDIETSPQIEDQLAKKLLASISSPFNVERSRISVSASIGIARYPEHGDTAEAIVKNADIAMYHVKNSGKNAIGRLETTDMFART